MKVLHVAETAKGGVGGVIDQLMQWQRPILGEHSVHALVPHDHRAQLRSVPDAGVSTWRRHGRTPLDLARFATSLARTRAAFQPDVVHLHSTVAGLVGRFHPSEAALVYSPHSWLFEMWANGPKRRAAALMERMFACRAQAIITVSNAERLRGIHAGIPDRLITVVHNGLDTQGAQVGPAPWEDRRRKILFVGRLDRQKGFDLLRPILARHQDRLCLRVCGAAVVGKDPLLSAPQGNVDVLGWLPAEAVEAQLKAADLLVVPSRWESLPLCALEAMRAGKPVIAFDVGGLAELVEDGVTGRILPFGDVTGLERALLETSAADLRRWGDAARARFVEHFDVERMGLQTLAVYRLARARLDPRMACEGSNA